MARLILLFGPMVSSSKQITAEVVRVKFVNCGEKTSRMRPFHFGCSIARRVFFPLDECLLIDPGPGGSVRLLSSRESNVRMDSQELVIFRDNQHSVLRYGLVLILLADDDARWQAAHGCIIASSLPRVHPGRYRGLHLGPHLGH